MVFLINVLACGLLRHTHTCIVTHDVVCAWRFSNVLHIVVGLKTMPTSVCMNMSKTYRTVCSVYRGNSLSR